MKHGRIIGVLMVIVISANPSRQGEVIRTSFLDTEYDERHYRTSLNRIAVLRTVTQYQKLRQSLITRSSTSSRSASRFNYESIDDRNIEHVSEIEIANSEKYCSSRLTRSVCIVRHVSDGYFTIFAEPVPSLVPLSFKWLG